MSELYIGVMSGTSLDGIDIVLCKIDASKCELISSFEYPFDKKLKKEILKVIKGTTTLKQTGTIDNKLGILFADAINNFIKKENIKTKTIKAIGLHGQTLWHQTKGNNRFSMQLGCPNIVSAKTKIKVVTDFRGMDIANGGQGAPFAPAFHQFIFKDLKKDVAVINIGGIANITVLSKNLQVSSLVEGWDTGCGNVLLDMWVSKSKNLPFDKDGKFAKSGKLNKKLLNSMLNDNYFKKSPPKSTGREYFNETWLKDNLSLFKTVKNKDIQRTLLELTAQSIVNDVKKTKTNLLIICGGGVKNTFLVKRLKKLSDIKVYTSNKYKINGDFMEAMAFAWFAYMRIHRQEINLHSVTGAKKNSILGGVYG